MAAGDQKIKTDPAPKTDPAAAGNRRGLERSGGAARPKQAVLGGTGIVLWRAPSGPEARASGNAFAREKTKQKKKR